MRDWRFPRTRGEWRIVLSFVADIYGASLLIVAIAASVSSVVVLIFGLLVGLPAGILGTVMGLLVGLSAGIVFTVISRYRKRPERTRLVGYVWTRASYEYKLNGELPDVHEQEIEFEVKAVRGAVRHVRNQYHWTGSGDVSLPEVLSDGHTLQIKPSRNHLWM